MIKFNKRNVTQTLPHYIKYKERYSPYPVDYNNNYFVVIIIIVNNTEFFVSSISTFCYPSLAPEILFLQ